MITMHKPKEQLNDLYTELKRAYLAGELEGVSISKVARDNEIMWLTAKGWLEKIKKESQVPKERKIKVKVTDRSVVVGVPKDWEWIKITVSQENKDKFDRLTREQKAILFKLFTIDLLNLDLNDSENPIVTERDKGLVNKSIALKVSPEAVERWESLETIRKGNEFSRSSWAINRVILPFINLMVK